MAAGPVTRKSAQFRSTSVTCLTRPPRVSSLAVVRRPACSSVRSRVVKRRKCRLEASAASRSARSPPAGGLAGSLTAGSPALGVLVVMVPPLLVRHRIPGLSQRYADALEWALMALGPGQRRYPARVTAGTSPAGASATAVRGLAVTRSSRTRTSRPATASRAAPTRNDRA